jgi:hypothetical protein
MLKIRQLQLVVGILLAISTVFAYQGGLENKRKKQPPQDRFVLWVNPGEVKSLDFQYGVGGPESQPKPPFRFIEEDRTGTSPKVQVMDGRGITWNVKWGAEARPSVFCTRLMWACGYFVQPEYFLKSGQIEGVRDLTRAKSHIADDGSFEDARFQLRTDSPEYLDGYRWTWTNNPFQGTREIQGLKILSLLVSNWDTKDSNLAMFLDDRTGTPRYLYAITDWGASLGRWGNLLTWTRGDCKGFADQTPDFVKRDKDGSLQWGFNGKNREEMTSGITVEDIRWLLQYLGQITDDQIRTGLVASGNSPEDVKCYAQALRSRIQQLQQIAN